MTSTLVQIVYISHERCY